MAKQDWQILTRLTAGAPFEIERVRLVAEDVAIEGRFDLPPLAQLSAEDQLFVAAFVRCHGSIKLMEQHFDVSYPTIKNRLNRIGAQLSFVEIDPQTEPKRPSANALLSQLERGDLSADEVIRKLQQPEDEQ